MRATHRAATGTSTSAAAARVVSTVACTVARQRQTATGKTAGGSSGALEDRGAVVLEELEEQVEEGLRRDQRRAESGLVGSADSAAAVKTIRTEVGFGRVQPTVQPVRPLGAVRRPRNRGDGLAHPMRNIALTNADNKRDRPTDWGGAQVVLKVGGDRERRVQKAFDRQHALVLHRIASHRTVLRSLRDQRPRVLSRGGAFDRTAVADRSTRPAAPDVRTRVGHARTHARQGIPTARAATAAAGHAALPCVRARVRFLVVGTQKSTLGVL